MVSMMSLSEQPFCNSRNDFIELNLLRFIEIRCNRVIQFCSASQAPSLHTSKLTCDWITDVKFKGISAAVEFVNFSCSLNIFKRILWVNAFLATLDLFKRMTSSIIGASAIQLSVLSDRLWLTSENISKWAWKFLAFWMIDRQIPTSKLKLSSWSYRLVL